MIEIEKRALSDLVRRDKLRRMTDAQLHSPREPESRLGENSYKLSSVKPCFKTVFLCKQNLINAALENSRHNNSFHHCSLGDTATRTTLMLAHALLAKADILRLGSLLFCATHSSEVPVLRSSVMEDRVARIENKFDELSSKFDQLALTLQAVAQPSIEATQRASETSVPNQAPQEESVPDQAFAPEAPAPQSAAAPELAAGSTLGQATAAQPCPVDVQAEYAAIRDAYQRVKLPPDLRLNDSRSGLRRQDQAQFNALVKSARFVETGFKVLAQMKANVTSMDMFALAILGMMIFALLLSL